MPVDISEALRSIVELDEKIDDLQEQRETFTDPLVSAAEKYYEAHVGSGRFKDAKRCSRCFFVFGGARENWVVFDSDCSWCEKPYNGYGFKVRPADLAAFL